MNSYHPKIRQDDLEMQQVDSDLVVFDARMQQAHSLNSTAAQVLKFCDGTRTPAEIAAELGKSAGAEIEEDLVHLALDELGRAGLLVEAPPQLNPSIVSRRSLIRAALLVLPAIATMPLPSPAKAGSRGGIITGDKNCKDCNCANGKGCRNPNCPPNGTCQNFNCYNPNCRNPACENKDCRNPACQNPWCIKNPSCFLNGEC